MLLEKIEKDLVIAIKSKDMCRVNVLRMLKTEIMLNKTSEKPIGEVESVINYYKKLSKAIEMPEVQNKPQYIDQIKQELKIIEEYMPKSLKEEEIIMIVDKYININNFGDIMKMVKKDIEEQGFLFDGKIVSNILKNRLNK